MAWNLENHDSAVPEVSAQPVRVTVEVLPAINYAMEQNGIGVIRSITVENLTQESLEDLELYICATPEFALPFQRHIDWLPAGKSVKLAQPKLILNGEYLAAMTEKVAGLLQIRLMAGEQCLFSDTAEVKVLAFDQWHGLSLYPEMLTAFVTPNHPELARIIARATEILGRWTGDTSMDAYQSQDPNRVLSQAASIFTAIKERSIAYAVSPASFEEQGQRVRLCDTVLRQKLGNCLELTLLYGACLEAVGLHPLMITVPGHIFTGLWLVDRTFPECVQDDVSLLTKRLASGVNEIAVVETTCVTNGSDRSFDDAQLAAQKNLTTRRVEHIIDVCRARASHIAPLPQRVHTDDGWEIHHPTVFRPDKMAAPADLGETIAVDPNAREDQLPKKAQWERKLLDLGLRNTLINLRLTRTQMPILTNSLDELENALADGGDFTILPRPAEWKGETLTFEKLGEMGRKEIIRAEFANKRLRSALSEGELEANIKELYRTARTALEENGANTLYLALGILRWYESKRSTKARYAPIILLPIEMVRRSAAQGYVIRLRDEDPQMNITLLEKLKQDFDIAVSGLDPLPEDDHGIDIRRVLTVMRQAVMDQPRWDVLETASLGIFSFSQFVMWNDIRNRTDDLLRNKVVRSLMEGKLCWEAEPLEIGDRVEENDVLLPMPADASQLFAIRAACGGKSFVLHGPPGTGKSQTITSLIANALAQGKRVLFVAEKMAALEVVQKRLEAIGIGPFCLELHSNKSRKKSVLDQLRRATEVTRGRTAQQYAAKAQQLAAMRAELDDYVRQLHKRWPCGQDLYGLINEYEYYKDAPALKEFDPEQLRTLTPPELERQTLAVERLIVAAGQVPHPRENPLRYITCKQYSQNLRRQLQGTLERYGTQLERIAGPADQLASLLGRECPRRFEEVEAVAAIASQLLAWYEMPPAWTKVQWPQMYFEGVEELAQRMIRTAQMETATLQTFEPGILELSAAELDKQCEKYMMKWALPRALGNRRLFKTLQAYAKKPLEREYLGDYIICLTELEKERQLAAQLLEQYGPDLGNLYNGKDTDWEKIAALASAARDSACQLLAYCGDDTVRGTLGGKPELRASLEILASRTELRQAKAAAEELLDLEALEAEGRLVEQAALCRDILANADGLKEWIAYAAAAEEARSMGLGNVVEGFEQGIGRDKLLGAYKKALLQGLISNALDESDTLNQFSGPVFNEKIQQFQRLDRQWTDLSRQEAFCRLAGKVPDFTREAAHSSELGILQRCIKSGGRGMSIRRLFDQIPNLLFRLCPCMLMSPISAAQYLDPKQEPFDIVVFDEASQLPTCKAVGALARGREAVIVGDPKQMPPTSFFATNAVDEDNLEAEDLESILDDCLALNMPQTHLLWHYRSRHESLIAFSNSRFYENKLFTFPSVSERQTMVRLVPVDGVFDRGKTRTNRAEAQAVVGEILRRYQDPALREQSIGIVTFNISQQHLIDDLLTEACAKDPELEKWTLREEEPLFIKNLENVQGDERDVILFSIGFGPDEKGKLYMNFGPLNREGGWRRLNVAVSRARCEMVVFSALRPDQIDLNRTGAEGVAALRAFLEYAQGRPLALEEAAVTHDGEEKTGIAKAISCALKEQGYETDLSVGRSEYRVDVGVIDPKDPDRYILGILLDGDSYGAAKTTRDRELAQIGVLNSLGWNVIRVWTVDWWDNSKKELTRICEKLQELLQQQPQPPELPPEPEKSEPVQQPGTQEPTAGPPVYQAAVLSRCSLGPEEFLQFKYQQDILERIDQIVETEAPVSLPMLTRRVIQSCGITRSGSRIQSYLNSLLRMLEYQITVQEGIRFYWRQDQDPNVYLSLRVNGEGENRRDIRDVPVQEVANAIYLVLYHQVSMEQEDLLRESANLLGYTRLGTNVLSALAYAVEFAQEQGGIVPNAKGSFVLSHSGTARAEGILGGF